MNHMQTLAELAADPDHGWSIGSFGAIGEFVRDAAEPAEIVSGSDFIEIATDRGALRIAPETDLRPLAWDTLSSDGESWGHALAFCVAIPNAPRRTVTRLGADRAAIRQQDATHILFDLGVGCGAVSMCLRTADTALIDALTDAEGTALLSAPHLMSEVLRAQPHRVLMSPAGRIEVFQPIPRADGRSPVGPHTHLLPKLIVKDRPHSSNTPIPVGLQSALSVHPRSPWRTTLGERHPFDPEIDGKFRPWLDRYGLPDDADVEAALIATVERGSTPEFAEWPDTRRGRTKARITLRRLAAAGHDRVGPWRALYDRASSETVEEADEAS